MLSKVVLPHRLAAICLLLSSCQEGHRQDLWMGQGSRKVDMSVT